MKKETLSFDTFSFDELEVKSRERAIDDYVAWLVQFSPYKRVKEAVKKADKLHTPWFAGQYVYGACKKMILDDLAHETFLEDGRLFSSIC